MATWPEARAAKQQRQLRERRHYTRDQLGAHCPECRIPMPLALLAAGITTHPTCGPQARYEMTGATS